METMLTQVTNYLLAQSWQIAILAMAITAASLMVKNKSAHVRYLLWLIVLAKCLVPPLFSIPLPIMPPAQQAELTPIHVQQAESASTFGIQLPLKVFETVDTSISESFVLPSAPAPVVPPEPTVMERLAEITIHEWLGFGWIVGVAAFLFFASIKALRTNRRLQRQRKRLPAKLRTNIEDLFNGLDLRALPKVWLVDDVGQPFIWGLPRGSIYLPTDFPQVDNVEHRRSVLMHELSHILRFDAVVNLLQIIAQAVFWFHPFVWWANRKLRQEREKCCDEMAIARLSVLPKVYSSAIVNMLISERESARLVPSLAVAGPVRNIEERIKTIMKPEKKFHKYPGIIAVVSVLLIAVLTVPTTLALTTQQVDVGSDSYGSYRMDSGRRVRYSGGMRDISGYDAVYSTSSSGGTDSKTQILYDCRFFRVPADLKVVKGEQKGAKGPIVGFGSEYTDRLEELSQENENVNVMLEPKILASDGKEATLSCDGIELKVKGKIVKGGTVRLHLQLTQSKPGLTTRVDDEGREIHIPLTESRECITFVTTRTGEPLIIGGLQSDNNKQLVLVITPYVMSAEGPTDTRMRADVKERPVDTKPTKIVEDFVTMAIAKEDAVFSANPLNVVTKQIDELREILGGKLFEIHVVYTDDETALVLVKFIKDYQGKQGHFVFRLARKEDTWHIDNIAVEYPDEAKEGAGRFREVSPKAKPPEPVPGKIAREDIKAQVGELFDAVFGKVRQLSYAIRKRDWKSVQSYAQDLKEKELRKVMRMGDTVSSWASNKHGGKILSRIIHDLDKLCDELHHIVREERESNIGLLLQELDLLYQDYMMLKQDKELTMLPRASRTPTDVSNRFPKRVVSDLPDGTKDYALQFDGKNDFVMVPPSKSLDIHGSFTLSAWVKHGGGVHGVIIWRGDGGVARDPYALELTQDQMFFRMDVGDGRGRARRFAVSKGSVDDKWHFWTAVCDKEAGKMYLYKDGNLEGSADVNVAYEYDTSEMWNMFGAVVLYHHASEHFAGTIDEVRIWNIARSQEQIRGDMNRSLSGTEPGLVGYWKFDEDEREIIKNSTLYLNNGVAGQLPWDI